MNTWILECKKIIRFALGNPSSSVEFIVLAILAAFVFVVIMIKVGDALDIPVPDTKRSIAVLMIGTVGILLVLTAVNFYLMPHITTTGLRACAWIASIIVALLAIAGPAICLIQRASYLSGLSSILLSIGASVIVLLLVRAGFRAVRVGDKGLETTRGRTEIVNEFLSK